MQRRRELFAPKEMSWHRNLELLILNPNTSRLSIMAIEAWNTISFHKNDSVLAMSTPTHLKWGERKNLADF